MSRYDEDPMEKGLRRRPEHYSNPSTSDSTDTCTTEPNTDPADPDEILHHITVADVETLHGMVLTEDQAEQVKDRLAQALTDAINEIRGIDTDEITSDDEMAFERQIQRDGR